MTINTDTLAAAIVEANKDKQGYFLQFSDGRYVGALTYKVKSKKSAMVTTDPTRAKAYSNDRDGQVVAVPKRKYKKAL